MASDGKEPNSTVINVENANKVKFVQKDDLQTDQADLLLNESKQPVTDKRNKPFKVQYYKDEKSLQFLIDFKKEKESEQGCVSQLKYISFYQACLAEFLAVFLLVLFAVGFGLNASPVDFTNTLTGAVATGFLVSIIVWSLAHVSGAHINPAVSLAFLVSGDTNIIRVLFYVPMQLLGSVSAVGVLRNLILDPTVVNNMKVANASSPQIGLTLLNDKLTVAQGVGIEAIITFILVITIFSCIDSKRKDLAGSFPLSVGLAVTVGILFADQFTGGSMNPARSFGPAVMSGNLTNHFFVYWIGPCVGGVIAALIYKLLTFKTSLRTI